MMKKAIISGMVLCMILSGCYLIPGEPSQTDVPGSTLTASSTPVEVRTSTPIYTATITLTPSKTSTPTKTLTPSRTPTITQTLTPTKTLTPTQTTTSMPYQLQADSPVYIENFVHTDDGCNWMGVAGQVFGKDGTPQLNLVLVVKGKINQTGIDETSVTGVPEADVYGPGGYEIVLADSAVQTSGRLTIQVFDLNGTPLSDTVPFDTYADCGKNLAVINFSAQ